MNIPVTTSYAGRQVDLELLQSISAPGAMQRVVISNVSDDPKMVAGVEKAIQRYACLLLTSLNDVHFNQSAGGNLVESLLQGTLPNAGYLNHLFGVASANALQLIAADDVNAVFGSTPADEKVTAATLQSSSVDYTTGTVLLNVLVQVAAGNSFSFILPVST